MGEHGDYVDRLLSYGEDLEAREQGSSEPPEEQTVDGSLAWVDALGRYAEAHVALRNLVVDVEGGEVEDLLGAYQQGIRHDEECIAAFSAWQASSPPGSIRLAVGELLEADGALSARLQASIESVQTQGQAPGGPAEPEIRRCETCGARNRIATGEARLMRCGRCQTDLAYTV
jgi:hypothetical protein